MKDVKKESIERESAIKKNTAKHRKRRKRNLSLYYFLMTLITVSVLVVLSLTVFFKITEIKIQGNEDYSEQEILTVSEIKKGTNLLMLNADDAEEKLLDKFLMIDAVEVKKHLPSKVEITITPATSFFQIAASDGSFLTVSSRYKVLAVSSERDESLIFVEGITVDGRVPGEKIGDAMGGKEAIVTTVVSAFQKHGVEGIKEVKFLSSIDIRVNIDERLEVKLGSEAKIDYKIQLTSAVINGELEPDATGVLDASVEGKVGVLLN